MNSAKNKMLVPHCPSAHAAQQYTVHTVYNSHLCTQYSIMYAPSLHSWDCYPILNHWTHDHPVQVLFKSSGAYLQVLILRCLSSGAYLQVLILRCLSSGAYLQVLIFSCLSSGTYPQVLIFRCSYGNWCFQRGRAAAYLYISTIFKT